MGRSDQWRTSAAQPAQAADSRERVLSGQDASANAFIPLVFERSTRSTRERAGLVNQRFDQPDRSITQRPDATRLAFLGHAGSAESRLRLPARHELQLMGFERAQAEGTLGR